MGGNQSVSKAVKIAPAEENVPLPPPSPPSPTSSLPTLPSPAIPRLTNHESSRRLRELLVCAICLEEFENPRILPCHHSFCFNCLENLITDSMTFECPSCKYKVCLHQGISELPADFRANSLQECLPQDEVETDSTFGATMSASIRPASTGIGMMAMFTCPVCDKSLLHPRLLNCGHSFCTECLEFMTPLNECVIYCLCCEAQTPVPDGVEDLQIDADKVFMMEKLSDPSSVMPATEEKPDLTNPEVLTCLACHHRLVQPRLLECGHSFCTRCLKFMTAVDDLAICCPRCYYQTPLPDGVEGLQIDVHKFFMLRRISD